MAQKKPPSDLRAMITDVSKVTGMKEGDVVACLQICGYNAALTQRTLLAFVAADPNKSKNITPAQQLLLEDSTFVQHAERIKAYSKRYLRVKARASRIGKSKFRSENTWAKCKEVYHIGFRLYREAGKFMENEKKGRFFGYKKKHDVWVKRNRIAPLGSRSVYLLSQDKTVQVTIPQIPEIVKNAVSQSIATVPRLCKKKTDVHKEKDRNQQKGGKTPQFSRKLVGSFSGSRSMCIH